MSAKTTVVKKSDLKAHNTPDNAWLQIGASVYDVSKFHNLHPGGSKIMTNLAGQDATDIFFSMHRREVLSKWGPKLRVGLIEGAEEDDDELPDLGDISGVPYGEAMPWQGYESPYYKDSHIAFREDLRRWLHDNLREIADKYEESGERIPDELLMDLGERGLLAAYIGPGEHMQIWSETTGKDQIMGVDVKKFDFFHEAIVHEEFARLGAGGFIAGVGDGMCIGLPPVVQFGAEWMKRKVVPDVITGKKRICLAISEVVAGSDVANITTVGKKTADGSHFVVSGTKKWITQGHHADYFVCATRTGDIQGMGGISLLLLEREMDGLETRPIKTKYSSTAGTALVIMEDVRVPVENIIGDENGGFLCIMYNFNHERWFIAVYILGVCRSMVDECFKWAMQRRAFGQRLLDQGVIRQKLAKMVGAVESCSHWIDQITFQMNNMEYNMQAMRLAGMTSLVKFQATRTAEMIADESVQIFGGRGITKTGMGKYVERFHSGYKFASILGGSEEILGDMAIKMAMKAFPENAKL